MAIKKSQIEKWIAAQKKHRLSDTHVQMARELGLNPDKLGKIDNHKQEMWKAPLPEFIEEIFYKRFKKERPDVVKPLKQILKEQEIKAKAKKNVSRNRLITERMKFFHPIHNSEQQNKSHIIIDKKIVPIPSEPEQSTQNRRKVLYKQA